MGERLECLQAVKELTEKGKSQREVAEILGVSHQTVKRDQDPVTNVTADGVPPRDIRDQNVTNITERSTAQLIISSESNEWYYLLTCLGSPSATKACLRHFDCNRERDLPSVLGFGRRATVAIAATLASHCQRSLLPWLWLHAIKRFYVL
jgi:predicted transcriptional regulator